MDEDARERSNSVGRIFTGRSHVAVDALGRHRPLSQLNRWEWAFLLVSVINIAISISLSVVRLVNVIQYDHNSPDFIFTLLMIANSLFCLFYVIHGLLNELEYEIYMFICAAAFVMVYCIVEFIALPERRTTVKKIRLILCCIFGPFNIGLAVRIARDFGWLAFRIIGASHALQHMNHQAALFSSLLKFDLQASVSFVILVLKHGLELTTQEIIILCCGVPFCAMWTLLGRTTMRRESTWLAAVFALLGLLSPVYILYTVVETYKDLDSDPWMMNNHSIAISLVTVGALAMLVRCVLYYEFSYVYRNFGKGLRERAFDGAANERTGLLAQGT